MNLSSRRKRALVFSMVLLAVVVAASATGLYIHRKSGAAATAQGQPGSRGQGASSGVALASTKTAGGTPADKGKNAEEKAPVPVSVAAIATGPVSSYISSTANLVAESEVKVLAEAEGRVAELHVEEGSRIGKGQVLAQLVKDDTEIALKKAQVRLENARINFERAEQEVADHLISREQFDKDHLDLQIAQQELAEAQWRLERTTIRAPFGGRVTERFMKLGQHVRPGDQLFTVSDFDPLIAKIFLPEKDVYGLKEGREVRITLKANDQTRFGGRILREQERARLPQFRQVRTKAGNDVGFHSTKAILGLLPSQPQSAVLSAHKLLILEKEAFVEPETALSNRLAEFWVNL